MRTRQSHLLLQSHTTLFGSATQSSGLVFGSGKAKTKKDFQVFDPHRVGKITVQLQGRVNDCRALTYRQDVKAKDIEEYKMQKLPTRQWGYVVITTPEGVLDHEEAVKRNVGGQVLGYFH
ncbi:ribosomal protein S15A E [Prunus dulcis]|uniref:Ribosomal protein S15A E n=1 Tax=Prunus dulcis TaxID=3755 RepID=A0A4Y1RD63_PRUDU|nr:ribosomal protein S15A E [Prunus dulcis]